MSHQSSGPSRTANRRKALTSGSHDVTVIIKPRSQAVARIADRILPHSRQISN